MNIGLDMMGGDFAPLEAVKGAAEFINASTADVHLTLIGDEEKIKEHLKDLPIPAGKYTVVHAAEVIEMNEHPTKALKEKKQSSIAIGFHLLATGKTDAFISAGNTGAMMVGALFSIKAIEGVMRPTIGAYLPREDGSLGLLVDVGLNADCKPENLNQFAILGSLFAKHILNFDEPKVGLVNLGEEEGKGNILAQAAYPLLKENKQINFIGNVEGRDILTKNVDVVVCDGYVGNIILKFGESVPKLLKHLLTQTANASFFDKIKVGLSKGTLKKSLKSLDYQEHGGVPLLGVNGISIIGHGSSTPKAIRNMVLKAFEMHKKDLIKKIENSIKEYSTKM